MSSSGTSKHTTKQVRRRGQQQKCLLVLLGALTLVCMNARLVWDLVVLKPYSLTQYAPSLSQEAVPPKGLLSTVSIDELLSAGAIVLGNWTQPEECPEAILFNENSKGFHPRSLHSSFAVAMISTGNATETRNVERAIQSIRRRGMFNGRIIVITDRNERYGTLEMADDQITILEVKQEDIHVNLKAKMPYKRFKTQVLDLMDTNKSLDHYTHVVYMDVDIVVGDNLNDFFGYVEQMVKRGKERLRSDSSPDHSFMMMFEEQGRGMEKSRYKNSTIWHSGVTVFHRQHSRRCLDIWREVIDWNRYRRDQSCLYYMHYYNQTMRDQCSILRMDDKAFFHIPTEDTMRSGHSAVFVHNTNTGRAKRIDKKVQYDYYRCAMMLDDKVVKGDILNIKRKKNLRKKEEKEGFVWDGLILKKVNDRGGESAKKDM